MDNLIRKQNILLVDDRPQNLLVVEKILAEDAFHFFRAKSGEEALRLLHNNEIALILLAVQMPGLTGYETAKLIRGKHQFKEIPIIFISATNKVQRYVAEGNAAGAVDYISGPLDPDLLRNKVKIFLELDWQRTIVERQSERLAAAKINTDNILKHVKEGIFVLNNSFEIKPQYSNMLECILRAKNLRGQHLGEFLKSRIHSHQHQKVIDFFNIVFNPTLHDSVIDELNPCYHLEYFAQGLYAEAHERKYISFDFTRIYDQKQIVEVLVTLRDTTNEVLLVRQLAEAEEKSKNQMKWLLNILHVDPTLLKEFIEGTEDELDTINRTLRNTDSISKCNRNDVFAELHRSMHLIKGNASLLDLNYFCHEANKFEEDIVQLKSRSSIIGNDILPLVIMLGNMQDAIEEIKNIIDHIGQIYQNFRPKRHYENQLFISSIANYIDSMIKNQDKEVHFIHEKFESLSIPYQYRYLAKEVIVHLVQNAIVHGLETKSERMKKRKETKGSIVLETFCTTDFFGFKFRDDGRGLNLNKLRESAAAQGKWKKEEIDQWDDQQLVNSIFYPGITTLGKLVSAESEGKGFGLDIMKQKISEQGGTVEVNHEKNKYCEFIVTLPLQKQSLKSA
jgi:CheY-like chemotaxis protein/HPt (histidine-containing phosphotransfer) domain-containing protein